jgi:hypothetical protein
MNPRTPSAARFAEAMATRLAEVMPNGLTIMVRDSTCLDVRDSDDDDWHASAAASILEERDGRSLAALAECAALAILDGTQDVVMEMLTEPWPLTAQGQAALPGARIHNDTLDLWFGDESTPALALRPLRLDECLD